MPEKFPISILRWILVKKFSVSWSICDYHQNINVLVISRSYSELTYVIIYLFIFHFQEEDARWKWKKPPPLSKKTVDTGKSEDGKKARKAIRKAQNTSIREKLLKGLLSYPFLMSCLRQLVWF